MRVSLIAAELCKNTVQKLCQKCSYSVAAAEIHSKGKWDLVSAICLERRPVISCSPNEIEKKFMKLLSKIEFERSHKSDHEIGLENERKQEELFKKGELDLDAEVAAIQTIQDKDDAYNDEFKKFTPESRITNADKENDTKSLNRMLEKPLVLVVHQKIGDSNEWILPQGVRENGETMRQAAERVLLEQCGSNIKAQFLSNAPCGFYKYKYPKNVREEGPVGAKVFFFKAWHVAGQVECNKSFIHDYRWFSKHELLENVHSEYYRSLDQFLIHE